jgi:hypothetical protein
LTADTNFTYSKIKRRVLWLLFIKICKQIKFELHTFYSNQQNQEIHMIELEINK